MVTGQTSSAAEDKLQVQKLTEQKLKLTNVGSTETAARRNLGVCGTNTFLHCAYKVRRNLDRHLTTALVAATASSY